ncbi:MAG: hypothetical protein CR982_00375 [Candidatus Cloacimonadota bacterium]|nr:MAG: hypothetical protein CR982_00375 [Candidatus Cloacimonadota bacterium]PIE78756.1 MAG: hypothetical protein CSA15_06135 [Candidatus Delongbacteria bacterium]
MFLTLFLTMILLSAFYSSSELAFSSVDRLKVMVRAQSADDNNSSVRKRYEIISNYLSNPDKFLIPILVGNNYVNVLYTYASVEVNDNNLNSYFSEFELIVYQTLILVVFAEILPKILAKRYAEKYLNLIIYPFLVFEVLVKPFSIGVSMVGRGFVKLFKIPVDAQKQLLSKDDIHGIVEEVAGSSEESKEDLEILSKVITLNDLKVKEIMTHRSSISGVSKDANLYELKKLFKTTFYSRFIVYEDNYDNIVGIVYSNDMISNPSSIKEVMREPYYIPSNMNVLSLFRVFKKEKISIAVVIDEFGGCEGIVTMHDIIEELVGRSEDQHSRNRWRGISFRKQKNFLIVNGDVELEDVEKAISHFSIFKNFSYNEMNYETLNGYIINKIGYIPIRGEAFEFDRIRYRIIKAQKNVINTIIIDLNEVMDGSL